MSARKMDCPVAVSCPLRLHLDLCPWVAGPVPSSQVLVLQVHWLGPEMLALVLFVRLLVPLLKEELRATGRSGQRSRWSLRGQDTATGQSIFLADIVCFLL